MRLIGSIIFGWFFSTTLTASSEEFYILPMGQGNGQLVVYNTDQPEHKVGVLYDLGSKSLQAHPKFMRRVDWSLNFTPNRHEQLRLVSSKPIAYNTPDRAMTSTSTVVTPETTERKVGESQRKVIKEDLQEFIKGLLSGLKHLILFLSHTDVDHINYISAETFPANLSVTAFLCGDWFGDYCDKPIGITETESQETKKIVKDVLLFLGMRKNTHLEFPYYWQFIVQEHKDSRPIEFNDLIRKSFQGSSATNFDSLVDDLKSFCLRTNYYTPNPVPFSGTFSEFLDQSNVPDNIKNSPELKDIFNNLYIWSINYPVGDVNDFSPIISCTLPSLKISVVFTGDAGLPVFQSVSCRQTAHPKNSFRETLSDQIDDQHLVLLMLPHHGSWLNISGEMLRFFKPNVFGISAGDGGQHGHPSLKTIEWIQKMARKELLYKTFNSRYKKEQDLHIIAIRDQEKAETAKYPHKVVKMRKDLPVFLCPNIYGCIKWNKEGIQTNFNNTLDIAGNKYYVAYASHELETMEKLNTRSNGDIVQISIAQGESIQKRSLTYLHTLTEEYLPYVHSLEDISNEIKYVGVPVEGKTYFYRLVPVDDRKRTRTTGEGSDSERGIDESL